MPKPAKRDAMLSDSNAVAMRAAGMVPDEWQAACRLQVAVRDASGRLPSLVQALSGLTEFFRECAAPEAIECIAVYLRKRFDDERAQIAETREADRQRIAATAGAKGGR